MQREQQRQDSRGNRSSSAGAPPSEPAAGARAAGGEAANGSSSSSGSPLLMAQASLEAESSSILLDATAGVVGPLVLLLEGIISARQSIQVSPKPSKATCN